MVSGCSNGGGNNFTFRNNYFSKPKKAPKQVDIYDERE